MSSDITGIVFQFALATLLPVAAATALELMGRKTRLAQLAKWRQQLIYGLIFGAIAVFGTEAGIATQDATMNVRDAAPIVAGLYFGGPAGIIAGLIGGIERWFAALWGRGMFTRVACTLGTIIAGFYAAFLRRHLFDGRRPMWPIAFAIGGIAEMIHLLLVFVTNLADAERAFRVVEACTLPMVLCNALAVGLTGVALALMTGQSLRRESGERDISQVIQAGMLVVVSAGFAGSVYLTYAVQNANAQSTAVKTLSQGLGDVVADVHDASDNNLLSITRRVSERIPSVADVPSQEELAAIAREFDVNDIHVIDGQGIIVASTDDLYLGFDMASGEQSAEFLDLLPGGSSTTIVQDYQPMSIDSSEWRKFAGVKIEGGFLQVAYASSQFRDDIAAQVAAAIANRHIDENGFFVVFDDEGKLMATQAGLSLTSRAASQILDATGPSEEGALYTMERADTEYLCVYQDVEGFRIVALLPVQDAFEMRDLSVLLTSFMEVIIFAILFAAIFILIRRAVVSSIWEVNGTLDQITSGDLEAEVDVRGSKEFSSLSDDINRTVSALRQAIAAESARIERDLATAKAIQGSALPTTFPPFPDIDAFDIYASMNAAREVGGDFYDFFMVDDHTLAFLIADVSGKGIPGALFMMAAKSELANYIKSGMALHEAVGSANRNLCEGNDAGMFVTVWAATLDYRTGLLTFVNAGHNPPLLRHEGRWEWLTQKGGLFLGTFETARYRSSSISLVAGDELLLYTDGVNEAFNVHEEEYGNQRLEDFLAQHADSHPHILIERLRADVRRWAKGAEQSDDITMLCLEYGVPPEVGGSLTVPTTADGLVQLKQYLHFELSQLSCPDQTQRQIELTVEELFTNVCQHAYETPDEGEVEFAFIYNANPYSVTATLTDSGPVFDPVDYHPVGAQADIIKGLGIKLAQYGMDDFGYVRDGDKNVVAFRKDW